jgi:hypothetical protein
MVCNKRYCFESMASKRSLNCLQENKVIKTRLGSVEFVRKFVVRSRRLSQRRIKILVAWDEWN